MFDTDDFTQQVAVRSGMSEGEVLDVLHTLADVIVDGLRDGDSVCIDGVSVLSASQHSDGVVATPDELGRL